MIKYYITDKLIMAFDTKTRYYSAMPIQNIEPQPLSKVTKVLRDRLLGEDK